MIFSWGKGNLCYSFSWRPLNYEAQLNRNYVTFIEERVHAPGSLWGYRDMPRGDDYS